MLWGGMEQQQQEEVRAALATPSAPVEGEAAGVPQVTNGLTRWGTGTVNQLLDASIIDNFCIFAGPTWPYLI